MLSSIVHARLYKAAQLLVDIKVSFCCFLVFYPKLINVHLTVLFIYTVRADADTFSGMKKRKGSLKKNTRVNLVL